jgi:CDP-diacylglycerol--glycerol-3-phosphate 3-phosphatidyltransferase
MANLITVMRFPVLLAIVLLFGSASPGGRLLNVFLIIVLILMDSLDGIIARRRNEVSLLGSVLDIMADRAVELVLWVCFTHLRLVPLAIPLIFILRGTVVDSLRSVHVSAGQAPFKAMRTPVGKWLVGSPVMRTSYGVVKVVSFAGLALTYALMAYAVQGSVGAGVVQASLVVFNITSWLAVLLCLVRGVPVVVEALPAFGKAH